MEKITIYLFLNYFVKIASKKKVSFQLKQFCIIIMKLLISFDKII